MGGGHDVGGAGGGGDVSVEGSRNVFSMGGGGGVGARGDRNRRQRVVRRESGWE